MTRLGKIVKSNSHTDYVCQIFGVNETDHTPGNHEYAFGTFVRINLNEEEDRYLVGLIYDTVLLNPDFGRMGPRLSSEQDLQFFSPDYLNERAVLTGILVIGQVANGEVLQGVPPLAATSDASVMRPGEQAIIDFHHRQGQFQLTYLPDVIAQTGLLARNLLLQVIEQLTRLMPDSKAILAVIADDLQWQLHINSMRGQT